MATRTTYLLISGVTEPESFDDRSIISDHSLERQKVYSSSSDAAGAVKYALERPLDDAVDLIGDAKELSREVPDATVLLCEVEERFDQIDAVRVRAFIEGQEAGEIEHGHVFNVGGR